MYSFCFQWIWLKLAKLRIWRQQSCVDYFSCKRVTAEETFAKFIVYLVYMLMKLSFIMIQLQDMTVIKFLLESDYCMNIKHTRYLLKSVLWYVCKDRPVNDGAFVVHASYTCCCYFDGVWNAFLSVLLH